MEKSFSLNGLARWVNASTITLIVRQGSAEQLEPAQPIYGKPRLIRES